MCRTHLSSKGDGLLVLVAYFGVRGPGWTCTPIVRVCERGRAMGSAYLGSEGSPRGRASFLRLVRAELWREVLIS